MLGVYASVCVCVCATVCVHECVCVGVRGYHIRYSMIHLWFKTYFTGEGDVAVLNIIRYAVAQYIR